MSTFNTVRMLVSALQQVGLNEKQAKIYLACLELGKTSIKEIARKSEVKRTTIYDVIDEMIKEGIIKTASEGKKKRFLAVNPKELKIIIKQRENLLEQILPKLASIDNVSKTKSGIYFYEGTDGMKIVLAQVLNEAKEILGFSSAEDHFANLGNYWPNFLKNRIKKKIPVKTILKDSLKAQERKKIGRQELREVKISPKSYDHHSLIMIWGDKIAMFSFKKEMMAIVIESKELAQSQRSMFYLIWDLLKK